jgi:hypothetical protein
MRRRAHLRELLARDRMRRDSGTSPHNDFSSSSGLLLPAHYALQETSKWPRELPVHSLHQVEWLKSELHPATRINWTIQPLSNSKTGLRRRRRPNIMWWMRLLSCFISNYCCLMLHGHGLWSVVEVDVQQCDSTSTTPSSDSAYEPEESACHLSLGAY